MGTVIIIALSLISYQGVATIIGYLLRFIDKYLQIYYEDNTPYWIAGFWIFTLVPSIVTICKHIRPAMRKSKEPKEKEG